MNGDNGSEGVTANAKTSTLQEQASSKVVAAHPDYKDHSERDSEWIKAQIREMEMVAPKKSAGGTKDTFPLKLHAMLDSVDDGSGSVDQSDIVRWLSHGRAFKVFDKDRFEKEVLPRFFRFQSTFASFQRQLNIYGFTRLTGSKDKNAYYNVMFLRGRQDLCRLIPRNRASTCMKRRSFDPSTEPDFSRMKAMPKVARTVTATGPTNGTTSAAASGPAPANGASMNPTAQLQPQALGQYLTTREVANAATEASLGGLPSSAYGNMNAIDMNQLLLGQSPGTAAAAALQGMLGGTSSSSLLGANLTTLSLSDLALLRSRTQASSLAVQSLLPGGGGGHVATGNGNQLTPNQILAALQQQRMQSTFGTHLGGLMSSGASSLPFGATNNGGIGMSQWNNDSLLSNAAALMNYGGLPLGQYNSGSNGSSGMNNIDDPVRRSLLLSAALEQQLGTTSAANPLANSLYASLLPRTDTGTTSGTTGTTTTEMVSTAAGLPASTSAAPDNAATLSGTKATGDTPNTTDTTSTHAV